MSQPISWDKYYQAYPINEKTIWLNNCGTTPASRFIVEEMHNFLESSAREGTESTTYVYPRIKAEIQEIFARLINTSPEHIALLHNTAEGMNMVSHGISLRPGDQILLMEDEYPSNVYPWEHWREKGVTLTFIPLADTPEAFLENVHKCITNRTRLIALSIVHWCTGMPLPIREISVLCKEQGILLAVDAAQAVGHVQIDMDEWGVPFLAFSCWKWLLGPVGMGCLVVPGWALQYVKPLFKGPDSVIDSARYLPYRNQLKPTTEQFMYSTGNLADWVYARTSLKMLEGIGFGQVQQRLYELAAYLSGQLRSRGFRLPADKYTNNQPDDTWHTAIIVADKPGLDTSRAVQELKSRGVITRERSGRIRFAPHIYNSFEQPDKIGAILDSL